MRAVVRSAIRRRRRGENGEARKHSPGSRRGTLPSTLRTYCLWCYFSRIQQPLDLVRVSPDPCLNPFFTGCAVDGMDLVLYQFQSDIAWVSNSRLPCISSDTNQHPPEALPLRRFLPIHIRLLPFGDSWQNLTGTKRALTQARNVHHTLLTPSSFSLSSFQVAAIDALASQAARNDGTQRDKANVLRRRRYISIQYWCIETYVRAILRP